MTPAYSTTVSALESLVNTNNPYWNVDRATGQLLRDIITTHGYTRVLEIGTSNGLSALYMASAVEQTGGHIITVESHQERFQLAEKHIYESSTSHLITQVKGHAPEVLDEITGMFDCIFIDATSIEYSSYYTHLKSRLVTGGSILADNVISHREKVQDFLDLIQTDEQFTVTMKDIGKGVLIAEKIV